MALGAIKPQLAGLLATLRPRPAPSLLQQNPAWLQPLIALVAACCRPEAAAGNPAESAVKKAGKAGRRSNRKGGDGGNRDEGVDGALSPTGKENLGRSARLVQDAAGAVEIEEQVTAAEGLGFSAASAEEHPAVKGFILAAAAAKARLNPTFPMYQLAREVSRVIS